MARPCAGCGGSCGPRILAGVRPPTCWRPRWPGRRCRTVSPRISARRCCGSGPCSTPRGRAPPTPPRRPVCGRSGSIPGSRIALVTASLRGGRAGPARRQHPRRRARLFSPWPPTSPTECRWPGSTRSWILPWANGFRVIRRRDRAIVGCGGGAVRARGQGTGVGCRLPGRGRRGALAGAARPHSLLGIDELLDAAAGIPASVPRRIRCARRGTPAVLRRGHPRPAAADRDRGRRPGHRAVAVPV